MPRPLFLHGAREQRTHSRATPEPTPSAKGSIDPAFIAGGTLILLAGSSAEAVASVIEGRWAAAGACIVAGILTLFFFGLASRMSARKRRELRAGEMIREAAERRAALRQRLTEMSKHDPRRGEVEREFRRNTLVVLGGGKF